ncbi:unnamed protein product [Heterobilharzia americana]|nr:unnamed protein product [Heterobilharzia americana]
MTSFAKACIDFSNNLKNLRFTKSNATVSPSATTVTDSPTAIASSATASVLAFESDKLKSPICVSHHPDSDEFIISITNRTVTNDFRPSYNHQQTIPPVEEKYRLSKNYKNSEPAKCKSTGIANDKSNICDKLTIIANNISSNNKSSVSSFPTATAVSNNNRSIKIIHEKNDPPSSNRPADIKHVKTIPNEISAATCTKKLIQNKNTVNDDSLETIILNNSEYQSLNTRISNSSPNSPVPRHHFMIKNKLSLDPSEATDVTTNKFGSSNTNSSVDSPFTFKATLSPTMTHRLAILARNCQNTITNNSSGNSDNDSPYSICNRYSHNSTSSSSSPLASHRGTTVAAIKQRLLNQGLRINLNIPVKRILSTRYRDYIRRQKRGCPHTVESLWLNTNFMNNIFHYLSGSELIHCSVICRAWYEFMCFNGFQNKLCFVLNVKKLLDEIENKHNYSQMKTFVDYKDPLSYSNHNDYIPVSDEVIQKYLEQSVAVRIMSAKSRRLETIKIVQLAERFSTILCNILEILLNPNYTVALSLSQSPSSSSNVPSNCLQPNTTATNTLMKVPTTDSQNLAVPNQTSSARPDATDENNNMCKTNDFLSSFLNSIQNSMKQQQQQNGFLQGNGLTISNYFDQSESTLVNDSLNTLNGSCTFKKMSESKISISSYLLNSDNSDGKPSYTHKFTHLIFKSCAILDQSLSRLVNLFPSLKHLEFECCNDFTELAFWSCLLPSIEQLKIFDCINVSDESMNAIGQMLPELKCFTFQAYHITDAALTYFSTKQRTNMHTMELVQCMDITNQGIMTLAYALNNLQVLNLSGCSKLTDDGLDVICENLKRLVSLNLSWCSKITDSGIECVACDLILLKKLLLDRCTELTDLGISHLATMPNLQHLSVRWCINLSDGSVPHLLSMTGLKYLCLSAICKVRDGFTQLVGTSSFNHFLPHLLA